MLERRHVRVATDHNVRQEGRQARPCAHEKKEWIVCCKIRFGDVALERAKRNILHSVLYAQFFYSCCVIAYSCTPTSGDGPRGPRRVPTYIRAMAEAGVCLNVRTSRRRGSRARGAAASGCSGAASPDRPCRSSIFGGQVAGAGSGTKAQKCKVEVVVPSTALAHA